MSLLTVKCAYCKLLRLKASAKCLNCKWGCIAEEQNSCTPRTMSLWVKGASLHQKQITSGCRGLWTNLIFWGKWSLVLLSQSHSVHREETSQWWKPGVSWGRVGPTAPSDTKAHSTNLLQLLFSFLNKCQQLLFSLFYFVGKTQIQKIIIMLHNSVFISHCILGENKYKQKYIFISIFIYLERLRARRVKRNIPLKIEEKVIGRKRRTNGEMGHLALVL